MASVAITVLLYNGPLLSGFNVCLKGLLGQFIGYKVYTIGVSLYGVWPSMHLIDGDCLMGVAKVQCLIDIFPTLTPLVNLRVLRAVSSACRLLSCR